ncbi:MAG TPA: hypothetical protein DD001_00290 [Microcoleaceae bacterium UBA10368]|nr:hypothetical protein [Microcoleaceae cyanobacterium UBA10368]HCV29449.1 hypothetical protein [Microcoleaceae cyanobacterium UBA9251]
MDLGFWIGRFRGSRNNFTGKQDCELIYFLLLINYLLRGDRTCAVNLQSKLEIFSENAIAQILLLPEIKSSGSHI